MKAVFKGRLLTATALVGVGLLAQFAPSAAFAQQNESVDAVVVTASRLGQTGFTSPTPTTVLGSEAITNTGSTNIAQALINVPAFRQSISQTPQTNGPFRAFGTNAVDLRGLGAVRTLVLIDGMRMVSTPIINAVNLNTIPTIAIGRTEIVTGGASAAWGSDAVAGVVNLIIDNKFNGFKAEAQHGFSQYGDDKEYSVSAAAGSKFAGGKGHVYAAASWTQEEGILTTFGSRPWFNNYTSGFANPGQPIANSAPGAGGLPAQVILSPVNTAISSPNGLIVGATGGAPASLIGQEFLANGGLRPFGFGQRIGNFMIGGDPGQAVDPLQGRSLKFPADRLSVYTRLDYDFSDSLSGFLTFNAGQSRTRGGHQQGFDQNGARAYTIRADNPFLSATVAALMPAGSAFTVGRSFLEPTTQFTSNRDRITRWTGGLKGKLGGNWGWDANAAYSTDRFESTQSGLRLDRNTLAADAVRVTAANVGASGLTVGSIACRSTLTAPANGCVPLNVLGSGSPSAAALAYVTGTGVWHATSKQTSAAASVHGDLINLWAGPLAVVGGVEYRKEQFVSTNGEIERANQFAVGNQQAYAGSYDTKEIFGEAELPLLKDVTLAERLSLNGAVRYTDYSTSGGVTTWKVGATYNPVSDILIRGAISRDIRAPNIQELYQLPSFTTTAAINRWNLGNGGGGGISNFSGGNVNLVPEIAKTKTAGVTYQPRWLSGFRASIDYYNISIANQIAAPGLQNIIDYCYQSGLPTYCALLSPAPPAPRTTANYVITQIANVGTNLAQYKTDGFDLEASYRRNMLGGAVTFRALATNVRHLTTKTASPTGAITVTERAGMVNAGGAAGTPVLPHWSGNLETTYDADRFSVTARLRWFGRSKWDNALIGPQDAGYAPTLVNSISDNRMPGRVYLALSGTYNVTEKVQVFGVVNNVFNKAPPLIYNSVLYDILGRYYRIGLRYGF